MKIKKHETQILKDFLFKMNRYETIAYLSRIYPKADKNGLEELETELFKVIVKLEDAEELLIIEKEDEDG